MFQLYIEAFTQILIEYVFPQIIESYKVTKEIENKYKVVDLFSCIDPELFKYIKPGQGNVAGLRLHEHMSDSLIPKSNIFSDLNFKISQDMGHSATNFSSSYSMAEFKHSYYSFIFKQGTIDSITNVGLN